jgi:hypothetical protein
VRGRLALACRLLAPLRHADCLLDCPDTEKNIVEKLVDTINDVVETVTTTAADALSDADQVPESDKAKEIKEGCEEDRQGDN